MKKIGLILLAVLVFTAGIYAEDGNGGYAASFLRVPIGARPAAMGGAYISIANDGAGAFYNPAGIANLQNTLFATSYRAMQLDRSLGYVNFMMPTKGQSALGINWLHASSGSVEARNKDGDVLGHELSESNNAISVIFAKRFEKFLALGFKGTYLHTTFAELTSFSVSFDLGATFYLSQLIDREKRDLLFVQDIRAGIVVRNLAAVYRWNNENYFLEHESDVFGSEQEDKVPFEIGLGSSARFFAQKLLLSTDFIFTEHQSISLHGGGEYMVTKQLALRSGYSDKSLTAGAGFMFNFGKNTLAIDYAFSSEKVDEGSEHLFSFDILF